MGIVELCAVSKRYRRRGALVLDRVWLGLEAGTLTQLRGANGSGKSTLLRLVCGFSRPTEGTVHAGYRTLGFVPDRVRPPERLSGRAYLDHLARLGGGQKASDAARLADRLGLVPGLQAPLGTLSRGNLRKVVLIQALVRQTDLLVMDEPFAALDDTAREELAQLLRERQSAGCAVLLATHGDDLLVDGRSLILADGRLVEAAGPVAAAPDVEMVEILLGGPHPSTGRVGRTDHNGVGYLVAAGEVEDFLGDAISSHVPVLRLNPVAPGRR